MNYRITANKYARKAKVRNIKQSKNKEFLIFEFDDGSPKGIVGFCASRVYYGNKTYLWISLLLGYFLPSSYNINTDNVIGKECFVVTDAKGVVRSIIPIIDNSKTSVGQLTQRENKPEIMSSGLAMDAEEEEVPLEVYEENEAEMEEDETLFS